MTLEELTGLSGVEAINRAYSAPIRRIKHTVSVGYWNKSGAYREEEFQVSGTLPTGITSLKITTDAGGFPVGKSLCSTFSLTFQNSLNLTENRLRRSIFKVQTSISIDGGQSYIDVPIGVFYPDTVKSSDNWKTVTVEGFDEMHFLNERKLKKLASGGTLYEAVKGFWTNMSEKTYQLLNSIHITAEESKILTGFSAREAFGHIAVKEGGFFKIDRYGDLMIGKMVENKTVYNDDLRDKYDFKADEEEKTIAGVRIGTSENYDENIIDEEYGNTYLNISSSVCSSGAERLTDGILGGALGFTDGTESFIDSGVFYTGKLSMRGNPLFEIGTVINFRERWGGNWHKRIIPTAVTYDLTGGAMDINADEINEELTEGSREYADQAYVNEQMGVVKDDILSEIANASPIKKEFRDTYDLVRPIRPHFGYSDFTNNESLVCFSHNTNSGEVGTHANGYSALNTYKETASVTKDSSFFNLAEYLSRNPDATFENEIIYTADKEDRLYIIYASDYSLIKNVQHAFIYDFGLMYHYKENQENFDNSSYFGSATIYYGTANGVLPSISSAYNANGKNKLNRQDRYSSFNSVNFNPNVLGLQESGSKMYAPMGFYLFVILESETTANVGYSFYDFKMIPFEHSFRPRGLGYVYSEDYISTDEVWIDGPFLYDLEYPYRVHPTVYGSVVDFSGVGYTVLTGGGLILGDGRVDNEQILTAAKLEKISNLLDTLTDEKLNKLLELIQ